MRRSFWAALALVPLLASGVLAQEALPVEIVEVSTAPTQRTHVLIGTVEATNAYPAAFRTGGRIVEMPVEVGDTIERGGLIARVDPAQAAAGLEAARASLQAAEAALTQAEQARDRATELLDRGVGTRAALDEAEQSYLSARSARDQAQAQLDRAEQAVEDTEIRAIEDVIVIETLADAGEVAGAGQAVVRLASQGEREAVFYAPDIGGLSQFRGYGITLIPGGGAPEVESRVLEVSPVLTDSGTVEVRAAIPEEVGGALVIGGKIEGRVTVSGPPVQRVPWTALTATAEGPAVWTVDPETMEARLTSVTVGFYTDKAVAVTDGLQDGDMVIGAGSQNLFAGRVVTDGAGAE